MVGKHGFFVAPASTRFHLSQPGGLVEHSIHVYKRLRELYENELYHDHNGATALTDQEEETVAICGLLHDICKIGQYKKVLKNQKSYDTEKVGNAPAWQVKHDNQGDFIWESVTGYEYDDPFPYGHGEKSVYIISAFMQLSKEEAMSIRWHMGFSDNDFIGGGRSVSSALEMNPFGFLVHIADMLATHLDDVDSNVRTMRFGGLPPWLNELPAFGGMPLSGTP